LAVACVLLASSAVFAGDEENAANFFPSATETQVQPPNSGTAAAGQNQNTPVPKQPGTPADPNGGKDDRMFFVMPNFLTVENEEHYKPLTVGQKFSTTAKGTFDPYEFVVVGILAGIRQADNAFPAFGQGMAGYGKRYGTAFADQVDGNMMVGAVYPTILKTDPRYFQLGTGRFMHRFGYALSRLIITKRDSGGHMFNICEFAGNATAIAISNLYYPAADRGFANSAHGWGEQFAIDALGNELKEFWPDIHRRIMRGKHRGTPPSDAP